MQKDPEVRFKNFIKSASKPAEVSSGSGLGAFGGKPKHFKGVRPRKVAIVPAWLVDPDQQQKDES